MSDKKGLIAFAQSLVSAGVELISTGGTAKALREANLPVEDISEYTGFPEMLDGRVKTLHPKVHGGLLFLRGNERHEAAVKEHGILPIDLVVVNLYPFEKTVADPEAGLAKAIENIDIGGPSMLRSAAKNFENVTVVVDPVDYPDIADSIQSNGNTTLEHRMSLAAKAFQRTSAYDAAIADFLSKTAGTSALAQAAPSRDDRKTTSQGSSDSVLPEMLNIKEPKVQALRYGENPHQSAGLYGGFAEYCEQLHGKELSYNNILDLTAAAGLISEFPEDPPTLAILKHTNPCGVGQGEDLKTAWDKAFATDKQAPFGGIIAVNTALDEACAVAISEIFSEVIIAPEFTPAALDVLRKKKNLRLVRLLKNLHSAASWEFRSVGMDSFLLQERDLKSITASELEFVTKRKPTETEIRAMLFGWRVVKHVKSNAIVFTAADRTLGVGAGQMSRVDSSKIAVRKASEAGLSLKDSIVCSDAFFPFPDALTAAADAGAVAAIQPGGSVRDELVIDAADDRDMAMAFTRVRHFRH